MKKYQCLWSAAKIRIFDLLFRI